MKYFLLIVGLFITYLLLRARYTFKHFKEEYEFYLEKVEMELKENPDNPILFCKRGSIYQETQNFIKANLDFKTALFMINNGAKVANRDELVKKIATNIRYTEKPLPWIKKGPKDLRNNWLAYFLIVRLGGIRFNINN